MPWSSAAAWVACQRQRSWRQRVPRWWCSRSEFWFCREGPAGEHLRLRLQQLPAAAGLLSPLSCTACPAAPRYIIPGGSAAHFHRQGFTFDVGSSMMFGFGDKGTTNLMTRALAAVGKRLDTVPDPTQIHYHLPPGPRHPQASAWAGGNCIHTQIARRRPVVGAAGKATAGPLQTQPRAACSDLSRNLHAPMPARWPPPRSRASRVGRSRCGGTTSSSSATSPPSSRTRRKASGSCTTSSGR